MEKLERPPARGLFPAPQIRASIAIAFGDWHSGNFRAGREKKGRNIRLGEIFADASHSADFSAAIGLGIHFVLFFFLFFFRMYIAVRGGNRLFLTSSADYRVYGRDLATRNVSLQRPHISVMTSSTSFALDWTPAKKECPSWKTTARTIFRECSLQIAMLNDIVASWSLPSCVRGATRQVVSCKTGDRDSQSYKANIFALENLRAFLQLLVFLASFLSRERDFRAAHFSARLVCNRKAFAITTLTTRLIKVSRRTSLKIPVFHTDAI